MKFLNRILLQFLIISLVTIIYFVFIELTSRAILGIASKDKNFLYYGFNKDILLEIVDLTELKFNFENINKDNEISLSKPKTKDISNNINPNKILWSFGASLTYGFSCGKDSSSWPNELQAINKDIKVINYGFPSIYSNDSIKSLKFNLKNNELNKPDFILWAHKTDEKLFAHRGLRFQKDRKEQVSFNKLNIKFIFLRIEKTFETNSISYKMVKHVIKKLQKRYNLYDEKVTNIETKDNINNAIENYKYNTIEAIEIAKKYNVEKFIIVSLATHEEFESTEKDYFFEKFNQVGENLSIDPKVKFINVLLNMNKEQKNDFQKFYCTNKHYTLEGNIEIAKILNEQIF